MNAKPIEAGCLALYTGPAGPPGPYRVVRLIPVDPREVDGPYCGNCWELNPPIGDYLAIWERRLIRVDDPELQREIESEQEKVCES